MQSPKANICHQQVCNDVECSAGSKTNKENVHTMHKDNNTIMFVGGVGTVRFCNALINDVIKEERLSYAGGD